MAAVAKTNDWDAYRKKPGIGTYSLAGFLYILPKVGALKLVAVKGPTQATEEKYVHSVLDSTDALARMLRRFTPPPATVPTAREAAAADRHAESPAVLPTPTGSLPGAPSAASSKLHPLPNRDLDTGNAVRPAGYPLTDETYASLLHRIALTPTLPIPPGIKAEIGDYYADLLLPFATRKKPQAWAQVQADLKTLQSVPTSTELDPFPTYDDDQTAPATTSAAPSNAPGH